MMGVVGGVVAVMVGVGLGGSRPLAACALTLALSRRAGEGTVVVLFGLRGDGRGVLDTDFRRGWGASGGCELGLITPPRPNRRPRGW